MPKRPRQLIRVAGRRPEPTPSERRAARAHHGAPVSGLDVVGEGRGGQSTAGGDLPSPSSTGVGSQRGQQLRDRDGSSTLPHVGPRHGVRPSADSSGLLLLSPVQSSRSVPSNSRIAVVRGGAGPPLRRLDDHDHDDRDDSSPGPSSRSPVPSRAQSRPVRGSSKGGRSVGRVERAGRGQARSRSGSHSKQGRRTAPHPHGRGSQLADKSSVLSNTAPRGGSTSMPVLPSGVDDPSWLGESMDGDDGVLSTPRWAAQRDSWAPADVLAASASQHVHPEHTSLVQPETPREQWLERELSSRGVKDREHGAPLWDWKATGESAILDSWMAGYDKEQSEFHSVVLDSELKVRQATIETAHLGTPNALLTAVAFGALDRIAHLFGRYHQLVDTVRCILHEAVYVRATPATLEEGEDITSAQERDNVLQYYHNVPFFARATLLELEKDQLLKITGELEQSLEKWAAQHAKNQASAARQTKARGKWQAIINHVSSEMTEMQALRGKVHMARAGLMGPGDNHYDPVAQISEAFTRMEPADQRPALLRIVEEVQHSLSLVFLYDKLTTDVLSVNEVFEAVTTSATVKTGVTVSNLSDFVETLCANELYEEHPDYLVGLLCRVIDTLTNKHKFNCFQHIKRSVSKGAGLKGKRQPSGPAGAADTAAGTQPSPEDGAERGVSHEESGKGALETDGFGAMTAEELEGMDPFDRRPTLCENCGRAVQEAARSTAQDWVAKTDPDTGDVIWVNAETGECVSSSAAASALDKAAQKDAKRWTTTVGANGKVLYVNTETGDTTEEPPASVVNMARRGSVWATRVDPTTGKPVYVNSQTGERQTDIPDELQAAMLLASEVTQEVDPETGETVWVNAATGERTKTKPALLVVAESKAEEWAEEIDPETGDVVFVNATTGERTSEEPRELAVERVVSPEASMERRPMSQQSRPTTRDGRDTRASPPLLGDGPRVESKHEHGSEPGRHGPLGGGDGDDERDVDGDGSQRGNRRRRSTNSRSGRRSAKAEGGRSDDGSYRDEDYSSEYETVTDEDAEGTVRRRKTKSRRSRTRRAQESRSPHDGDDAASDSAWSSGGDSARPHSRGGASRRRRSRPATGGSNGGRRSRSLRRDDSVRSNFSDGSADTPNASERRPTSGDSGHAGGTSRHRRSNSAGRHRRRGRGKRGTRGATDSPKSGNADHDPVRHDSRDQPPVGHVFGEVDGVGIIVQSKPQPNLSMPKASKDFLTTLSDTDFAVLQAHVLQSMTLEQKCAVLGASPYKPGPGQAVRFGSKRGRELSSFRKHSSGGKKSSGYGQTHGADGSLDDVEATFFEEEIPIVVPWERYINKGGKKVKMKHHTLANALALVYDCYEKKIAADQADDVATGKRRGAIAAKCGRMSLPDFIKDFLLQKFGLPSLADQWLYGLVEVISNYAKRNPRMWLFGVMCGTIESDRYNERLCDVVLSIYKLCVPKFTATFLRNRNKGECFVTLSDVLAAINGTFTLQPLSIAIDQMQLTEGRLGQLCSKTASMAFTFSPTAEKSNKADTFDEMTGQQVVDLDAILPVIVETWWEQTEADRGDVARQYRKMVKKHGKQLDVEGFKSLVQACTPDTLTDDILLQLYKEVSSLDGDASNDIVSGRAFELICARYGISRRVVAGDPIMSEVSASDADAAMGLVTPASGVAAEAFTSAGSTPETTAVTAGEGATSVDTSGGGTGNGITEKVEAGDKGKLSASAASEDNAGASAKPRESAQEQERGQAESSADSSEAPTTRSAGTGKERLVAAAAEGEGSTVPKPAFAEE